MNLGTEFLKLLPEPGECIVEWTRTYPDENSGTNLNLASFSPVKLLAMFVVTPCWLTKLAGFWRLSMVYSCSGKTLGFIMVVVGFILVVSSKLCFVQVL